MSSTSTLLIGYYHGLLLRDTSADSLMGDLYANGLISAEEQNVALSGHSSHHRNWLLLEHVRHMDSQALLAFSELVKNVWPQIGMQLVTGIHIYNNSVIMHVCLWYCICVYCIMHGASETKVFCFQCAIKSLAKP